MHLSQMPIEWQKYISFSVSPVVDENASLPYVIVVHVIVVHVIVVHKNIFLQISVYQCQVSAHWEEYIFPNINPLVDRNVPLPYVSPVLDKNSSLPNVSLVVDTVASQAKVSPLTHWSACVPNVNPAVDGITVGVRLCLFSYNNRN